jgi:hypothetical protein
VAEKLEAIVSIGMANTRLKDYYDLRALVREGQLDTAQLTQAIEATFRRRGTHMPEELPVGLSDEFSADSAKRAQWKAFLGRNRLADIDLGQVVAEIREFLKRSLEEVRIRLRVSGR